MSWEHPTWTSSETLETTYPTTVLTEPAPRRRRWRDRLPRRVTSTVAVAAVVGALVGGGAGVGAALLVDGNGRTTSSTVDLGSPGRSATQTQRPAGSVAGIAAKVLPSVVNVSVETAAGGDTGSGVVLSSDGYVLTNNHVIAAAAQQAGRITVEVYNRPGQELPADIVGRDPASDLAVIRVRNVSGMKPATLGSSGALVVGDPVIAIGSPLGLAGTVTSGIVSAKDRPVRAGEDPSSTAVIDAIQTDAPINPGNSGGPLVSALDGSVVGINSAIATLGGSPLGGQSGSIGLGFAIPIDYARSIAQELINTGRASHPVIGVRAGTLTDAQAGQIRGAKPGAYVDQVVTGGPADKAGIQAGDIVVAVDGVRVTSVDELIVEVRKHHVGDRVTVTVVRDGSEKKLTLTLASDSRVGA